MIDINVFVNYQNTKIELENAKDRLQLISCYEEQLLKEKQYLLKVIALQEHTITQIEMRFEKLDGIENKLYKEIVICGAPISKAIEKVAFEEEKDVSTLWKNYYPKVKRQMESLQMFKYRDELKKQDKRQKDRINS